MGLIYRNVFRFVLIQQETANGNFSLRSFLCPLYSGSPPMPSTSSSSLTNDVPKPPAREQPSTRPPYTPTLGGQAPHSHQFPRTRKMFDKGPEQVKESFPAGKISIRRQKIQTLSLETEKLGLFGLFVFRRERTATSPVVTGTTSVRPCRPACVIGAPSILLSLS